MATLSSLQHPALKLRPVLPAVPPLAILRTKPEVLWAYLSDLDKSIQDLYTNLSQKNQGYVLAPMRVSAVGPAETSLTVLLSQPEKDTSFTPLAIPSWDANLWVVALTVTGFEIHASVAPGGAGGEIRWILVR
jgi:hypothetical protein